MAQPATEIITVKVDSPSKPYPVLIGSGVRNRFSEQFKKYGRGRAFWVTDKNVADAWGDDLGGLCSKSAIDIIILPPGEYQKRLTTVERICQILLNMGAERGDTLIACGGGVVGDIVGFTAACYQRGVAFVQIPTTLLAMVDASVGGKTGVDLPEGKNLVGAFHQPQFVLIDTDFLSTLDEREFLSGYAEVVKTALVGDADLYEELTGFTTDNISRIDSGALCRIIERCVRFKGDVVVKDERESDLRRILNFGHTIGHALETAGEYTILKHGEAVFWGMSAAVDLSFATGRLSAGEADAIQEYLAGYLQKIPALKFRVDDLQALILSDKKVKDGKPNFVLLETVGKPVITNQIDSELLDQVLNQLKSRMDR